VTVADQRSARVLVVDDDPAVGMVLAALLDQAGIACRHVLDANSALAALREQPVDVVVTDLRMPGASGLDLLEEIVERWPEVPVILLTAHARIEVAVEAMKKGAADFLCKPFDREEILFTVRKQIEAARHHDARPPTPGRGNVVASASPRMREVDDMIRRASQGNFIVLIRGENGTGKDVAARAIHEGGPRRAGPFVRVQCGAFPEALIESELFGYEKGAFSGAAARRPGRVDVAEGGTLFLDEIGDVPLAVQAKLLRLLQEREYERLGSSRTLTTTARFIAATHRPLEEMIQRNQFREDLFWRLNVLSIWIPPLRERADDIEELALRFCREAGVANGRGARDLSPAALALLARQPWPGNVRQLKNFVERLVIMSDGDRLTVADVDRELARQPPLSAPPGIVPGDAHQAAAAAAAVPAAAPPEVPAGGGADEAAGPSATLEIHRREAEKAAILTALERSDNNRTLAARLLGISRRTLYHKLGECGIA
jgi:two-component system response regulator AtoC